MKPDEVKRYNELVEKATLKKLRDEFGISKKDLLIVVASMGVTILWWIFCIVVMMWVIKACGGLGSLL